MGKLRSVYKPVGAPINMSLYYILLHEQTC